MEKLHVVTLVLEMIGFGLAYIHVFQRGIADRVHQFVTDVPEVWRAGILLPGPETDKSLPLKTRNAISVNNGIFRFLQFTLIGVSIRYVNFGPGFLWGAAKFLLVALSSFLAAMLAFFVLGGAVNRVIALAVRAGKGHAIIGTGFFLAVCGMAIETYQVWESTYSRVALLLWGIVLLLTVGTLFRQKQGPAPAKNV